MIKPVASMEEGFLDNFISFVDQDYPVYEVIFALSEKGSPLISVFESLRERFPSREIRWVIVDRNEGPNYKVGNLIGAVREARYETLIISDSDMRVGPDYLRQVMAGFVEEKVGLVTCLYRGMHINNVFTALQSLFIQTDFIPNVLLDHKLEGISYGFGATICTRKEILTGAGELEDLAEYLADDYQMANRIHKKGYAISLSPYLIDHISSMRDFREYFLHHLRWAVTQRVCRPLGYGASIITQGVSLAMLYLIMEGFSPAAAGLFLFVCGVRLLSSAFLNETAIRNREVNRYLWLVPVKDLLHSVIWGLSLFVKTVHWKNRRFRLLTGGKMVEL
jgi:ceramide glucosyltransferase